MYYSATSVCDKLQTFVIMKSLEIRYGVSLKTLLVYQISVIYSYFVIN